MNPLNLFAILIGITAIGFIWSMYYLSKISKSLQPPDLSKLPPFVNPANREPKFFVRVWGLPLDRVQNDLAMYRNTEQEIKPSKLLDSNKNVYDLPGNLFGDMDILTRLKVLGFQEVRNYKIIWNDELSEIV